MPAPRSTGFEPLPTVPPAKGILDDDAQACFGCCFSSCSRRCRLRHWRWRRPQETLQNTERLGRAASRPCRPSRRARPALAAGARRAGDFRPLHLRRPRSRPAWAPRSLGLDRGAEPRLADCSFSAGSAAGSSPRSRIPASAPPAAPPTSRRACALLRLFDDLDGRDRRRDGRTAACWSTSPPS